MRKRLKLLSFLIFCKELDCISCEILCDDFMGEDLHEDETNKAKERSHCVLKKVLTGQ